MAVESNGTFLIDSAMKAQQWELAKGNLRALVAIQGSYSTGIPTHMQKEKPVWEVLESAVNAFIKKVEDNGLHE